MNKKINVYWNKSIGTLKQIITISPASKQNKFVGWTDISKPSQTNKTKKKSENNPSIKKNNNIPKE